MARILLVEDESDIRNLMRIHLTRDGHEVVAVESGEAGLEALKGGRFDLGVFDWMLPGLSGLDLCQSVAGKLPVLMVTARAEVGDIVTGLSSGADDYVTKPFEIPVFLARVAALLRRTAQRVATPAPRRFRYKELLLDADGHEVTVGGQPARLTPTEFRLLRALMENAGRVMSREHLIDLAQGEDVAVVDRAVDTHVFAIRKKIGEAASFIETIRGVGYRVSPGVERL